MLKQLGGRQIKQRHIPRDGLGASTLLAKLADRLGWGSLNVLIKHDRKSSEEDEVVIAKSWQSSWTYTRISEPTRAHRSLAMLSFNSLDWPSRCFSLHCRFPMHLFASYECLSTPLHS
jgi:hypothetical protein